MREHAGITAQQLREHAATIVLDIQGIYRDRVGPLLDAAYEIERLRAALQRLADCDWVITPGDRMDGVRKIAREALGGYLP